MHILKSSNPKNGYSHSSTQEGWENSAPRVGFNEGQLKDEEYDQTLAIHNPLWRYIIKHYPKEAQCPVTVVGYNSIPIAIELSQWTYPIIFMTNDWEGVKKAKRDNEIHAGVFKEVHFCDFIYTLPRSRVVTFINTLGQLEPTEVFTFLDMALRRSNEIVASEKHTKDWFGILKKRYNVTVKPFEDKKWCLITIKQRQPPSEV